MTLAKNFACEKWVDLLKSFVTHGEQFSALVEKPGERIRDPSSRPGLLVNYTEGKAGEAKPVL